MLDEQYGHISDAVLCFFKKSPSTSVVLEKCCFAVELQKCFVDDKTSPDFQNQRLNFLFWVNVSFNPDSACSSQA